MHKEQVGVGHDLVVIFTLSSTNLASHATLNIKVQDSVYTCIAVYVSKFICHEVFCTETISNLNPSWFPDPLSGDAAR